MQKQVYTSSGVYQSDDAAATANSLAGRDGNGDLVVNLSRQVGLVNTGGVVKTASFTADTSKSLYLCNAASGAITATLPAAATSAGLTLRFKKTDNVNNVVLDGNASETIDGATTKTLSTQYQSCTIYCDGSNWHVLD